MKETANFGLKKPEANDFYDFETQNDNMDEIDRVLQEYKDGTQRVGDSAKLGGKDASEYAEKTELNACTLPTYIGTTEEEIDAIYTSLHENAVDDGWYRARVQHNVAHSILGGGIFYVEGFRATVKFGIQEITVYKSNTGVKKFVRSLANNVWGTWDSWLPLSGGTIGANGANTPLKIKGSSNAAYTEFLDVSNNSIGAFGVKDLIPVFIGSGAVNTILHTGNKPSGSYTGNGDATLRVIETGGIGSVIYVYGGGYGAHISQQGGIVHAYNSNEVSGLMNTEAGFSEGNLTMATDKAVINASGVTYKWEVL